MKTVEPKAKEHSKASVYLASIGSLAVLDRA